MPGAIRQPQYFDTMFGELRVATPRALFETTHKYRIDLNKYSITSSGGGTLSHSASKGAIALVVDGASGSAAKIGTDQWFRYETGKTQQIRITGVHTTAGSNNQVRRWGYMDDNDGIFFQLSGTVLSTVLRTSTSGSATPTEITYPQTTWNVDRMAGNGPSGQTIDMTKGHIWEIQFGHLGHLGFRTFVDGWFCHEQLYYNTLTTQFMKSAALPVRCEVINNLSSSAGGFELTCVNVNSLGGESPEGFSFSAARTTDITVNTTLIPILSIQPTGSFNGIDNRIIILPKTMTVTQLDAGITLWQLLHNPTLTAPTFAAVDATNSSVTATDGTPGSAISGGQLIAITQTSAAGVVTVDLTPYFGLRGRLLHRGHWNGVGDILTIAAISTGGTQQCRATISWQEIE